MICQLQFLLSLVNDILDIKMIEKGVFKPNCDAFNINETLDFVAQMFEEQAKMKGNKISYHTIETKSLS